jgi:hypothetical protein
VCNVKAGGTYSNHVCFEELTTFGCPVCYSLRLLKDILYYEAELINQYRNSELINVFFLSVFRRVLDSSRKYNTSLTCPLTVVYFPFFRYDNSEIFIGLSLNRVFNYVFIVQYRAAYLACPVTFCSNSCSLQPTVSIWGPGNAFLPVHLCSPVHVLASSCGAALHTADHSSFFPPCIRLQWFYFLPVTILYQHTNYSQYWPGWLSQYSDWLRAGRSGDRIPVAGARFSTPVQTGPDVHSASYTMGTGSFPGVKRPGRGVDHPPPSIAEVKERVELYLYSPFGPSWPVLGWNLPLPLP